MKARWRENPRRTPTKQSRRTQRRKDRQMRAFLQVTTIKPGTTEQEIQRAFDKMWPGLPAAMKQDAVLRYGGRL